MNRFPVEITFEGVKYTFQISRLGPSLLELAIADKKPFGQVRVGGGHVRLDLLPSQKKCVSSYSFEPLRCAGAH